jgi:hypothetical protein
MKYALLLAAACTAVTSQAAVWEFDLGPTVGGFGLNGQNASTPSAATGHEAELGGIGIQYDDDSNELTLHYGWGNVTDVDGVNLTANFSEMYIHGPADAELYDLVQEDLDEDMMDDGIQNALTLGDPFNRPAEPPLRSGYFDFVLTLRDGVGGKSAEDQEADLRANLWYISIRTADYPNGEIRGQLLEIPETEHYAAFAGLALLGFAGYRRFKLARA